MCSLKTRTRQIEVVQRSKDPADAEVSPNSKSKLERSNGY